MRILLIVLMGLLAPAAYADLGADLDVAYGPDPAQRLDVYFDPAASAAPVIVMLHGGAWAMGDKRAPSVWKAKADYFVPRGYVFVSVNTRLLPQAGPAEQVSDFAEAVAYVQHNAAQWGGDAARTVVMGHSAGAHVASVTASNAAVQEAHGISALAGMVSLDTATSDLVALMEAGAPEVYRRAFGEDPANWRALSPLVQVRTGSPPLLLICSTRWHYSCPGAKTVSARAAEVGVPAEVIPIDAEHGEVDARLGVVPDYTEAVGRWIDARVGLRD